MATKRSVPRPSTSPSIPGRVGTAGAGCDPGLKKKNPKGIGLKASCGRRRLFFCSWPGGKPGNRRYGRDKSLPCTGGDKKWHGGDAPRGVLGKSRSGQAKAMVNFGAFLHKRLQAKNIPPPGSTIPGERVLTARLVAFFDGLLPLVEPRWPGSPRGTVPVRAGPGPAPSPLCFLG